MLQVHVARSHIGYENNTYGPYKENVSMVKCGFMQSDAPSALLAAHMLLIICILICRYGSGYTLQAKVERVQSLDDNVTVLAETQSVGTHSTRR